MENNVKPLLKDALETRVCMVENARTLGLVSTAPVQAHLLELAANTNTMLANQMTAKTELPAPITALVSNAFAHQDLREDSVKKISLIARRTRVHQAQLVLI